MTVCRPATRSGAVRVRRGGQPLAAAVRRLADAGVGHSRHRRRDGRRRPQVVGERQVHRRGRRRLPDGRLCLRRVGDGVCRRRVDGRASAHDGGRPALLRRGRRPRRLRAHGVRGGRPRVPRRRFGHLLLEGDRRLVGDVREPRRRRADAPRVRGRLGGARLAEARRHAVDLRLHPAGLRGQPHQEADQRRAVDGWQLPEGVPQLRQSRPDPLRWQPTDQRRRQPLCKRTTGQKCYTSHEKPSFYLNRTVEGGWIPDGPRKHCRWKMEGSAIVAKDITSASGASLCLTANGDKTTASPDQYFSWRPHPAHPDRGYPTKCTDEVFTCVGAICYTKHQAHDHLTTCSTFHGAADLTLDECKNAAATLGLPVAADSWQGDEGWTNLPKGCVGNLASQRLADPRSTTTFQRRFHRRAAAATCSSRRRCAATRNSTLRRTSRAATSSRSRTTTARATRRARRRAQAAGDGRRLGRPVGAAHRGARRRAELGSHGGGRRPVLRPRRGHWAACTRGRCRVDNLATFQELMADGLSANELDQNHHHRWQQRASYAYAETIPPSS